MRRCSARQKAHQRTSAVIAHGKYYVLQAGKRRLLEYGEHGTKGPVYKAIHVCTDGIWEKEMTGSSLSDEEDQVD